MEDKDGKRWELNRIRETESLHCLWKLLGYVPETCHYTLLTNCDTNTTHKFKLRAGPAAIERLSRWIPILSTDDVVGVIQRLSENWPKIPVPGKPGMKWSVWF